METDIPFPAPPTEAPAGGKPPRASLARTWFMLILPPLSLTAVSIAFGIALVRMAGGDRSVLTTRFPEILPFVVMVHHTLLFAVLLWCMRRDGLTLRAIGWGSRPGRRWHAELAIGVLCGVAMFAMQQWGWQPLVNWLRTGVPDFRMAGAQPLGSNLAMKLIVATLFAGVVEESVYRGYALGQLRNRMGAACALAVTTLMFMPLHFGLGWSGMLITGINGALLGAVFVWRRMLLAAAMAHAVTNALLILF